MIESVYVYRDGGSYLFCVSKEHYDNYKDELKYSEPVDLNPKAEVVEEVREVPEVVVGDNTVPKTKRTRKV